MLLQRRLCSLIRLRNHDLLTSLDVLTTGSYLRLPTCIKARSFVAHMTNTTHLFFMQKMAIPPTPLTDADIAKTLFDMEETIRYRVRMSEIIPVEMSRYHIGEPNHPLGSG